MSWAAQAAFQAARIAVERSPVPPAVPMGPLAGEASWLVVRETNSVRGEAVVAAPDVDPDPEGEPDPDPAPDPEPELDPEPEPTPDPPVEPSTVLTEVIRWVPGKNTTCPREMVPVWD
jgi:hypothetical protein